MLRAIETPKRGLGDSAIKEFDQYCALVEQFWGEYYSEILPPNPLEVLYYLSGNHNCRLFENPDIPRPSASLSARPLKLFADFSRQMALIRDTASYSTVSKTLQFMVEAIDLGRHLDKISKSKDEYEERLANIEELTKAAMRYDGDGACLPVGQTKEVAAGDIEDIQSPLGSFLDDISMVTELAETNVDNLGDERFVASFMTIHSSKGMEFDSVFFVGIEDGTIPSSQVSTTKDR